MTDATPSTADTEIRARLDAWANAIRLKDVELAMPLYEPDVVSFDLRAPLEHRGSARMRRHLEEWFAGYEGALGCELRDVHVEASGSVAFVSALIGTHGTLKSGAASSMWLRATLGWRKTTEWRIAHAHVSVPFDAHTLQARLDVEP